MKEKQPIVKKLKEAGGKVADYLKGDPENWPEELRQVEFYAGIPIDDVLRVIAGVVSVASAGFGTLKALKRIPSGYEGVRVTLGRAHGRPLKEGVAFTDPTRRIQGIALVDMTPQEIDLPTAVKSFTKDGTQVTSDITVIIKAANPKDVVRVIHPKPIIRLDEEPEIKDIVGRFTDALAREVVATATTGELIQARTLRNLREGSKVLLQQTLDETLLDERGKKEVREKLGQGIPRGEIKRGVIVQATAFSALELNPEVVEAMQEVIGAPMRVQAEKMLQEALGPDYGVARSSQAAEQVAREPRATIVFGVGAAEGGLMGRIHQLEEKLEGGGGPESIEDIRDYIDKLRGEEGR